jgi:hypothetical protein
LKGAEAEAGGIINSVFEPYTPKKVRIEGAVPHDTPRVEFATRAAVSPPDPTYTPNLPKNVGILFLRGSVVRVRTE